jgi:hypothetical protein
MGTVILEEAGVPDPPAVGVAIEAGDDGDAQVAPGGLQVGEVGLLPGVVGLELWEERIGFRRDLPRVLIEAMGVHLLVLDLLFEEGWEDDRGRSACLEGQQVFERPRERARPRDERVGEVQSQVAGGEVRDHDQLSFPRGGDRSMAAIPS